MLTAAGPKVLEFNCRFGDPETQAVLPTAANRSARALPRGARAGRARPAPRREFADDWAVTVVLASAGYPESSSKGDLITGLDAVGETSRSPTPAPRETGGGIVTAGGRVLNVTALGPTVEAARRAPTRPPR